MVPQVKAFKLFSNKYYSILISVTEHSTVNTPGKQDSRKNA